MARAPRPRANSVSVPAPVGGWNARDALDAMAATDAVVLTNWWPSTGQVETRYGYESYATGLGAAVEALYEFNAGATRKFRAAAGGAIYDISSAGAVGAALASGFASDRWQVCQFDDASGGARAILVNGTDAPQIDTGSAISNATISGSGLTTTTLKGAVAFKSRVWYWQAATQDLWYSATNAIAGVLTKFPLGRVSGWGGNIQAVQTWTVDGGDGIDDKLVILSSSGDVIVYAGTDPASASTWALQGIYRLGATIGPRCAIKVGGDLVITTADGYTPLSSSLVGGRSQETQVSSKISGAVVDAVREYGANFGWQTVLYPRRTMALFNVPVSTTTYHQHVLNTSTGAWTKFEGMNGASWALFNDDLYFGDPNGTVWKADTGFSDGGSAIRYSAQTAWNYFGDRARIKRFTGIRLLLRSEGTLPLGVSVSFDQATPSASYTTEPFLGSGALWDTEDWDSASWAEDETIIARWKGVSGIGRSVSTRVIADLSGQSAKWYATDYVFEVGGII